MTKQYESLFKSFAASSHEEQLQKIREIRNNRNIERPATAKRRIIKEEKTKRTKMDKARDLLAKMSPEQRAALLELKGKGK